MTNAPCERCGGSVRRSRRTPLERLFFSEAYRCENCGNRQRIKAAFLDLRYAHYVKCPRCHSVDLTVLKRRDLIDRMQPGVFNFVNRFGGGKLYHCWFCRLQFYDVRQRYNTERPPGRNLLSAPNGKAPS